MAVLEERWWRVDQARAQRGEESMRKRGVRKRGRRRGRGLVSLCQGAAAGKCMNDSPIAGVAPGEGY